MKNEVKKKMNTMWHVVMYQSHRENDSQEENFNFLYSKVVVGRIAVDEIRNATRFAKIRRQGKDNGTPNRLVPEKFIVFVCSASIMRVRNLRGSMINGGFR